MATSTDDAFDNSCTSTMSHRNHKTLFLSTTIALLCTVAASGQSKAQENMLPLWQRVPEFEFSWLEPQRNPVRSINMGKLNSVNLSEVVEEARRIVLIATTERFKSDSAALPRLLNLLRNPDIDDRLARLAFLSAAVALSDETQAEELWEIAIPDPALSAFAQDALIDWQSQVALEDWRLVLEAAASDSEALQLSIRGVAAAGKASDAPALLAILQADWASDATRLNCAKAIGQLSTEGLESTAKTLLERAGLDAIMAAHVLRQHSSPAATEILQQILDLEDGLGKAIALAAIIDADKQLALSLAKPLLKNPESSVRELAVRLLGTSDDILHLREQGYALRDEVPEIRQLVRDNMLRRIHESPEKRQFVQQAIDYYLRGDFGVGAEEAIKIAVAMKLSDRSMQFVSLLEHPSPHVSVRAAWGLQEIAQSTTVLDQMMPSLEDVAKRLDTSSASVANYEVARSAFLMGAFGRNRYSPAQPVLEMFVPKAEQKMRTPTRAAAIWALGSIHSGSQNEDLARTFSQRMLDNNPNSPEEPIVKFASAIALGMIQATTEKEALESVSHTRPDPLGYASVWALERLAEVE